MPQGRSNRTMRGRKSQRGLTLVELMIASVIALAITAALVGVFVNSSRARTELDRSNRQIESGRYAVELLSEDLRVAGFFGEVLLDGVTYATPSACAVDAGQLGWNESPLGVPVPLQAIYTAEACLSDRAAGPLTSLNFASPAIAIRRLSTNAIAPGAIAAGNDYVQVSACKSDPIGTPLEIDDDASDFTLRSLDCATLAPVRRIMQRTYFIASCSNCGADTIPSLKRVEMAGGALQLDTLVEGIEAIGLDLGFDTDNDGSPDAWRLAVDAAPGTNDWSNVMAVRLHVLSRTTEVTAGYQDTKVYALGLAGTVGPFNDGFKRRVYSTVVRLNNPAGRREL